MRILLVEDDDPKLSQLSRFIMEKCAAADLDIARSLNAACRKIDIITFDLIFLDMSLPTFDGVKTQGSAGRQKTFGGKELLMYLWENEIETPVYVLTQFRGFPSESGEVSLQDLHSELMRDFPPNYNGFVFFEHSSSAWQNNLSKILEKFGC